MVVALASCASADAGGPGATRDAPWDLLGVSANGRALRLAYDTSGCWWRRPGRPTVSEGQRSVHITIRQSHPPTDACRGIADWTELLVRLRAPIGGRRVEGEPRLGDDSRFSQLRADPRRDTTKAVVPRVVGLAHTDAVRVLRLQHFRARAATAGQEVAWQRPRPGAPIPWDGKGAVSTVLLGLAPDG
jgi:hypothetical protein